MRAHTRLHSATLNTRTKTIKMCDEKQNCDQVKDDQSDTRLSLLDLPIEIFLHICSFLDASTLVRGLSLVCKQFHEILNDGSLWKVRISHMYPHTDFPILPPADDDELFWKLSCVALEKQASLWRKDDSMEKVSLYNAQYSTIDGLLLMQDGNVCISGARDRTLVCWKLPTKDNEKENVTRINNAHNGWIWDLTSIDDTVYSCSWDQTVKAWGLTDCGLVHIRTYEKYMRTKMITFAALIMGRLSEEGMNFYLFVPGSLLCITSYLNLPLFATGSFCRTVSVFDTRLNSNLIAKYVPHRRAVIKLAMNSEFILSASEDGTVSIWDQRAGKIMKNVTISQESFPQSICMQRDIVYVGDNGAKLHILDPKQDFEVVKCFSTKHKKGINGIRVAPGCLITSSTDETVRISSPTDPPQLLDTLESSYGEIAGIDYSNNVLAYSGTDGIEIWRPK